MSQGKYQSHHQWLLGGTEEDVSAKLAIMGCTLIKFVPSDRELQIRINGPTINSFFASLEKSSKTVDVHHPVSYQQFWGECFVKRAMKKAHSDDDDIVKIFDESELNIKKVAAIDAVVRTFTAKISSQERKVGEISTSIFLAPSSQKALMQKGFESERAIQESIVR